MNEDKMKKIIKFYQRQKFRAEKELNKLKEKQLSFYGQWSKGYFEGKLSTVEGILEKLQELYEEGIGDSIPKKKIKEEINDWKNVNKVKTKALYNQDELVKIVMNVLQELLEDK